MIGGVPGIFLSDLGTDRGLVPTSLRVHFLVLYLYSVFSAMNKF